MGLFNFLKKKEREPTPAITASIHAQTVEVKQQTRGELPLAEIGGYVSPSGGFVNYGRFCVTGVNSTTGRKNTKRYETQTEADARAAAALDGLVEPNGWPASLLPFVLMAKTPSISPKACPRYLIPERIPNFQGILFPLPAVLKPSLLIFRRK